MVQPGNVKKITQKQPHPTKQQPQPTKQQPHPTKQQPHPHPTKQQPHPTKQQSNPSLHHQPRNRPDLEQGMLEEVRRRLEKISKKRAATQVALADAQVMQAKRQRNDSRCDDEKDGG